MDERRHVDELDRGAARRRRRSPARSSGRRAEEDEHRAQPLAAGRERVGPDLADEAGVRADGALEALLEQLEVGVEARRGADGGEGAHATLLAAWRATIPPPRSRQPTSSKPARRIALAEIVRAREAAHARRQIACRRRRLGGSAPRAARARRTRGGRTACSTPRGRGDLEAAEASAGPEHTRQLAQAGVEVRDVADPEADGGGVEAPVRRTAARAGRRGPTRSLSDLLRARSSIRSEKSSPVTVAPGSLRLEGQVAGAAAGIEHPVAGPHDRADRQGGASGGRAPPSSAGSSGRRPERSGRTSPSTASGASVPELTGPTC